MELSFFFPFFLLVVKVVKLTSDRSQEEPGSSRKVRVVFVGGKTGLRCHHPLIKSVVSPPPLLLFKMGSMASLPDFSSGWNPATPHWIYLWSGKYIFLLTNLSAFFLGVGNASNPQYIPFIYGLFCSLNFLSML